MLDVISLCAVTELSVTPTNSSLAVLCTNARQCLLGYFLVVCHLYTVLAFGISHTNNYSKIFLFSKALSLTLGSTHHPVWWVPQ
jgi:hypothetical protein